MKMTSCRDITNSVYPVTMTTIRHSFAQYWNFLGGAYNQAVVLGITRPLHATDPTSLKKMSLKKFQVVWQPYFVATPFSWLQHRSLYCIDGIRFFQIADVCSDVGNQLQVSFNQHNQTFVLESV